MSRQADLTKHTLNLREGDWDFIESCYKPRGIPTAHVIRSIVSNFVDKLQNEKPKPVEGMKL
jgi:hypothetical protein